jgi:hypothetical protein
MFNEENDTARFNRRLEIVTTIILAIASLLTAWGGYQASQWGSTQSISLSQASTKRVQATQLSNLGGQDRLVDIVAFTSWVDATAADDQRRADFLRARFRDEFTPVFEAWMATQPLEKTDAPSSPLDMPDYAPARSLQAAELEKAADALYAKGAAASDTSSAYVRASLFVAASLFFAAISKTFEERSLRLITLGLSGALLLFGAAGLIRLPIA